MESQHDLAYYGNYGDNLRLRKADGTRVAADNFSIEDKKWPAQAREIITNAGLQPEYSWLLKKTEKYDEYEEKKAFITAFADGKAGAMVWGDKTTVDPYSSKNVAKMMDGKMFVPYRSIVNIVSDAPDEFDEYLGYDYDKDSGKIKFLRYIHGMPITNVYELTVGKKEYKINGTVKEIERAPVLVDGVPMICADDLVSIIGVNRRIIYDYNKAVVYLVGGDGNFNPAADEEIAKKIVNTITNE